MPSTGTNSFASFDGLDIQSAHNEANNEAQSASPNQDSVQGASGGEKGKQGHIGSATEDYVEFKKMQTRWKVSMKRRGKTESGVHECLDEVDSMVCLLNRGRHALFGSSARLCMSLSRTNQH